MDIELFKKTESSLYRYFKYKKDIINYYSRIKHLETEIEEIDKSMKTVHNFANIDPYQNGAGLSERVQTSSTGTSYVESEMIKEVTKLEREQCNIMKNILKLQLKKREKEKFIQKLDTNIEMLDEEEKRFVELKYGDKKGVPEIADRLNMARATAYRKRAELVENISQFMHIIK